MGTVIYIQVLAFRPGMSIVPRGKYRLVLGMMRGMRGGICFRVVRPQFSMAFLVRTDNRTVMGLAIMVWMLMRRRGRLMSG
jgi:hypothetical protein